MKGDFRLEAQKFADEYKRKIQIRCISTYHDRFIIADGLRCWHIGASIKDAGNKAFAFSELLSTHVVTAAISDVNTAWKDAALVAQVVSR